MLRATAIYRRLFRLWQTSIPDSSFLAGSSRPFKTLNRTGRKWQFSSRTLMTLILIRLEW